MVQGEEVVFNVLKAMTYRKASDNNFSADLTDTIVDKKKLIEDSLEVSLTEEDVNEQDGSEVMEYAKWLDSYGPLNRKYFDELGVASLRPHH
uniref:Uncharacterized protein n=1 Tax=Cannabis sativa TaxID=3483 RepID=A0A803QBT7_CANSA